MKRILVIVAIILLVYSYKNNLIPMLNEVGKQNSNISEERNIKSSDKISFNTDKSGNIVMPIAVRDYYKDIDFEKCGKELFEDLAELTVKKHTKVLDYRQRHKYLKKADQDLKDKDKVHLIYTNDSELKKKIRGGRYVNTEHIYPRSLLKKDMKGYTVGDLHHLRYCNSSINSTRSNRPFTKANGECKKIGKHLWYPSDKSRGDVARMIMYLKLRYNEDFSKVGGIDLFLEWNKQDPVDDFERQRNNQIEKVQGNRNPFIDNSDLANRIWKKN